MRFSKTATAIALLLLSYAPANSATVTKLVTFSAINIIDLLGVGNVPPADPVTGSFTITLDPTLDVTNSTTITLNSLNLALGSQLSFNYHQAIDALEVGGANFGAGSLGGYNPSRDDFWLYITGFLSGTPAFYELVYSQTAFSPMSLFGNLPGAANGTITVVDPPSQVPLPAALPLFAAGLGGFTLLARRAKRKREGLIAAPAAA